MFLCCSGRPCNGSQLIYILCIPTRSSLQVLWDGLGCDFFLAFFSVRAFGADFSFEIDGDEGSRSHGCGREPELAVHCGKCQPRSVLLLDPWVFSNRSHFDCGNCDPIQSLEDLPHEEDVLHSPYSLKAWLRYLDFKTGAPFGARKLLYERALKQLPGSYKLWFNYLIERKKHVKGQCIASKAYKAVNNAFERALVYMNKVLQPPPDFAFLAI